MTIFNQGLLMRIRKLEKAEVMNDHFQSVFTNENSETFPLIDYSPYSTMSPTTVSASGINKLISNLDSF